MTGPTNVLVILSDEHTRRVFGAYGNPLVRTPNLDALAKRGTRFASAYCQTPICVPSRGSLATGRWPHAIDSWDNATPYVGTEAPSWGHRLTAQGHHVTTIGKLHYRRVDDPSGFPDQRVPLHVLDGTGDLYGLLRGDMPPRPQSLRHVIEARAGESEYVRYDRAIADTAVRWLREEAEAAGRHKPWVLFVGFVSPHFPLVVPDTYFDLYRQDALPLPVAWTDAAWSRHPVHELHRHQLGLTAPLDEATVRRAMAAYYGLVTFLDEQIGRVLSALAESGFDRSTRVIYTSDHGEMLGEHGLWWKSTMFESAVTVPLVVAGPDMPAKRVVRTNAMLVDVYPTLLEMVGAAPAAEDADLPGRSLVTLARGPDADRRAFSEYHAIFSNRGTFMLRLGRWKYVHHVAAPPELFDLETDPDELCDLGLDPGREGVRRSCKDELLRLLDAEAVDARARADQKRRLDAGGGIERIRSGGPKIVYTPPPREFQRASGE
jgi:choline-sulfatase